jgi:putative oxidoreductase
MKYATIAARALLALIFVVFSLNFWLNFIKLPPPPEGSSAATFIGVLYMTGYLAAVKVLELLGGLLVATGRFTPIGLLILGPIILNILFVDLFLTKAFNPLSAMAALLALFLLWTERARFAPLVKA